MEIIRFLIFVAFIAILIIVIIVRGRMKYKYESENHRICKKCGSHQKLISSYLGLYWKEVEPFGNDKQCNCHSDAI